jgi:hypothetical protein
MISRQQGLSGKAGEDECVRLGSYIISWGLNIMYVLAILIALKSDLRI